MLVPATDIAIAVSKSTAEFVINARQMPPERVKVVYLGVPLEEFSRTRTLEEIAAARHELGVAPDEFLVGSVTRLHDSKGNSYLVDAAQKVLSQRPKTRFVVFGEGPLAAGARSAGARARARRPVRVQRLRARRRARRVRLRHQRVPVALGGHAAHGVRGARDGEADRGDRRRRPGRRADPRPRRRDRPQARRGRPGGGAACA